MGNYLNYDLPDFYDFYENKNEIKDEKR